ncbi:MAG: sugar ABC transporter permease [Chloroflexota bacterium]|nr:MAG: sugar ABC transporter permease [Chloroflexota bacterium]
MTRAAIVGRAGEPRKERTGLRPGQHAFVWGSLIPIFLYLGVFALFPMIWVVVLSFFNYSPVRVGDGPLGLGGRNPFIGFGNFVAMFGTTQAAQLFRTAMMNTLLFAVLVLVVNLAITLPLAVLVESVHERLKGFFRAIYFLPTVSSAVAVAIMWGYVFHPQQGLINNLIKLVGLTPPRSWLTDPNAFFLGVPLAMVAVIIAYVWMDFGYNLVIFIAALQGIPREIRDAAHIDGATGWAEFRRITVPLLRPTLLLVCTLTMISSFQVFVIFQVMTSGGPQNQTRSLTMEIYENAFRYQAMGWASSISLVLFAMVLLVTLVQFRVLRTDWEY